MCRLFLLPTSKGQVLADEYGINFFETTSGFQPHCIMVYLTFVWWCFQFSMFLEERSSALNYPSVFLLHLSQQQEYSNNNGGLFLWSSSNALHGPTTTQEDVSGHALYRIRHVGS